MGNHCNFCDTANVDSKNEISIGDGRDDSRKERTRKVKSKKDPFILKFLELKKIQTATQEASSDKDNN